MWVPGARALAGSHHGVKSPNETLRWRKSFVGALLCLPQVEGFIRFCAFSIGFFRANSWRGKSNGEQRRQPNGRRVQRRQKNPKPKFSLKQDVKPKPQLGASRP